MSSPFFQNLDPAGAPDTVTPADTPSNPAGYAAVTPAGIEPAPYSISAPQDIAGITAAFDSANALSGDGVLYPRGQRQAEAQAILESPQGATSSNVIAGFPDYESADVLPPAQAGYDRGMGAYPGTTQGGVPQYPGPSHPLEGVAPEAGTMAGSMDDDYMGTTQPGVPKYGTS